DIAAGTVATIGFALLACGIVAMALLGGATLVAGIALALAVVGYDVWHKGNPAGPAVMGLCRALVYAGAAAAAVGSVPCVIVVMALAMLVYVAGITCAAQQESYDRVERLWPLAALAAPAVVALVALARSWLAAGATVILAAWTSAAVSLLVRRSVAGAVSH